MEVREISERIGSEGLTVLVNPQWTKGNLVSDFGIGPWRRRNEEFVGSFQQTYVLKQMRISGDNVRSGFLPHDLLVGACMHIGALRQASPSMHRCQAAAQLPERLAGLPGEGRPTDAGAHHGAGGCTLAHCMC